MHPEDDSLASLASLLADDLSQQAEIRVELLKAEVSRDARAIARDMAPYAMGAPLLAVGYIFASVGAGLALVGTLGTPGAFLLIGGLNLVGGAAVVQWGGPRTVQPTRTLPPPAPEVHVPRHLNGHGEAMNGVDASALR